MTVVADVLAQFRADTSDLEAGAQRATKAVSAVHDSAAGGSGGVSLSSHFDDASESVTDFAKQSALGEGALDAMGKKATETGLALKQMVLPIIGAAGLGGLLDMAKNTSMELQTLQVQFNSTFGGSGTAALKSAISDANEFGVSISAAAGAYQSFGLATKGTNQNMTQDMKDFADVAAGTGLSIDQVSDAIGNYYQLIQRVGGSGGQASRYATTLLTSHIITPEEYNQLRLLGNQGASAQQELNSLMGNAEGQYAGAGKAQANTLGGQIQTFKNQFSESLGGQGGAFSPIVQELQSGLKSLNSTMDSTGFKTGTKDLSNFVAEMVHGASIMEPFAKTVAEVALDLANMVTKMGPLGGLLGLMVAGFVAWKAIDIAGDILRGVMAMGQMAGAEAELAASTTSATTALTAQAAAVGELRATGLSGIGSVGIGGVLPSTSSSTTGGVSDAEQTSTFQKMGTWMTSGMGLSVMTLVGSQLLGHAVGGSLGSGISTVGGMAGAGAMIGTMVGTPGVGTAVGAGIGAAAGLIVNAFQSSSEAAAANTAAVNKLTNTWEQQHPIATVNGVPTAAGIQGNAKDATEALKGAWNTYLNQNGTVAQGTSGAAGDQEVWKRNTTPSRMAYNLKQGPGGNQNYGNPSTPAEQAAVAAYEKSTATVNTMNENLSKIATSNGLTVSQAGSFATQNGINLTAPLQANINAIQNATTALQGLGGAAEFSAEQVSSAYANIAAQVSGQYGEQTANPLALITTAGKASGLNSQQSENQFFNLAGQAGVDLPTMGITPQTLQAAGQPGSGDITPQEAQLKNQMLSTTLQYTDAINAQAVAVFQLTQANFQLGQAEFSLGRSQVENMTAMVTQQDATAASTTAINSGYLPANANVAASLAQVTSLTSAQINAINAEVASFNSLEAAMYSTNSAGQSLFSMYTTLQGAVQSLQAQTQQYQNLLNEPLQGSEAYSQAQEQYKVQEAAIQQQIDQLELQRVPTDDPHVKTLQAQLGLLQAQADLSTQINTQGVGQQQFNIQQAQLGPQQSYQTQMQAAQAVGALNVQLLAAQQALAPVNASYIALNTQLTVASQKNSAVTGALQQQATADQSAISSANSLLVAQNSVTTSAESVKEAQQSLHDANVNVQTTANTLASQLDGNVATALQETQGYITNIGVSAANIFQGLSQMAMLAGQAAAAQLSGNQALYAEYQALIKMAGSGPITPGEVTSLNGTGNYATGNGLLGGINPNTLLPQAAAGGLVGATGAVNVHAGEAILTPAQQAALAASGQPGSWNQIYSQILTAGGTQIQAMAGAALANGIESSIGGGYGAPQSMELSGGKGPAQGLFQFEPQTWVGDGGGAYGPIAGDATWQQQVAVFVKATGGNHFGSWGPDFGYGYGANAWPPMPGSHVANMVDAMFGQHFANGGYVPGSGPVPAVLHGGEFVVSKAMLAQLNGSGTSANGRGMNITLGEGAISLHIEMNGGSGAAAIPSDFMSELQQAIEDAFNQLMMKWNGG